MYTKQDQSPCDSERQIVFWHLRRLAGVASQWCNVHAYIIQKSQSGEFPRNLRHVTTRSDNVFICYYLVKMYAARGQSPCSLLASPPCSTVCVTPFMLTLHSTDHYITISHPVTLTTTTTSCLSGNLTRAFGANLGGFPPKNPYILHDAFGSGSTALNHYYCVAILHWFKKNMQANPDQFQAISFGKKGNTDIT